MPTYAELQAQIAELKKEADRARLDEIADAKAKIMEIMDKYGLTLHDISAMLGKGKTKNARAAVPAKYRDPKTGATWTGRGRAPLWLNGREKEDYRIK
ncbi:H-NS histone family protein [Pseudoduganella sp. RAF53_2]|uniref:H-NS histone family protein n=1 Tax=unclassified Pseudoduganella TaxID=2637179 RepID=UPI003F98FDB9